MNIIYPKEMSELIKYLLKFKCILVNIQTVCYAIAFQRNQNVALYNNRKYPLRGYILGSGAPGTPGVIPKTYGTTFISDIL